MDKFELLKSVGNELRYVLGVSKVTFAERNDPRCTNVIKIIATPSLGKKCQRCWHYESNVGINNEHPDLCERCINTLNGIDEKRLFA